MSEQDIRILIVDDTVVYRRILTNVVEAIPGAVCVGTASNGKLAVAKVRQLHPDLVFLDVEMPVMDGLETLEHLQADHPEVGVIMVSGTNRSAADITIKALERGAIDFVSKPESSGGGEGGQAILVHKLRPLVRLFTTRKKLGKGGDREAEPERGPREEGAAPEPDEGASVRQNLQKPVVRRASAPSHRVDAVAIGVSTGGPNALAEVIPRLPGNLGVPVFLVQHMPPLFTKSLANGLAKKSALAVCEASEGERVMANTVYIAPGGRHMVVRKWSEAGPGRTEHVIGLNDNPPENSCRPAVDVLFRSIAVNYGGNTLAVIMTGMGSDGCEGVRALKRRGSYCLSQSKASCVVYGMPQAVDEAGLSDETVPLGELAGRIEQLVRESMN